MMKRTEKIALKIFENIYNTVSGDVYTEYNNTHIQDVMLGRKRVLAIEYLYYNKYIVETRPGGGVNITNKGIEWRNDIKKTANNTRFIKINIIDIIKVIRGEFHNRVTLLLIITGIGLITSTVMEQLIAGVVKEYFGIILKMEENAYYGISLIVISLVYWIVASMFKK